LVDKTPENSEKNGGKQNSPRKLTLVLKREKGKRNKKITED
jgi:hypothetical protein